MRLSVTNEDGVAIVEVMVASVVLVVAMLGVLAMVDVTASGTSTTLARERATTLARDVLERARDVPAAHHGTAAFAEDLRAALPGAAAGASGALQVRRGSTTYSVTASSCKVDDDSDGVGVIDASFCDFDCPPTATCATGATPPPGAPAGTAVKLKLLGIPLLDVPLAGGLVDDTICSLLGVNPIGANPLLDVLLGRKGVVNTILSALDSGVDVGLCPGTGGDSRFLIDRDPADFIKVAVTARWQSGSRPSSLTQAVVVANPGGA